MTAAFNRMSLSFIVMIEEGLTLIKIMFVCFGNICRSPMAEFVMKHLVRQAGLEGKVIIESSGTDPSVGTPMSDGTRGELRSHSIEYNARKTSAQFTRADYRTFDYIVGMDRNNVLECENICGGDPDRKIYLLLDFAGEHRSVADPWYTDDYATTYIDVLKGCNGLLEVIRREV